MYEGGGEEWTGSLKERKKWEGPRGGVGLAVYEGGGEEKELLYTSKGTTNRWRPGKKGMEQGRGLGPDCNPAAFG